MVIYIYIFLKSVKGLRFEIFAYIYVYIYAIFWESIQVLR